jgi:hypothetical protein
MAVAYGERDQAAALAEAEYGLALDESIFIGSTVWTDIDAAHNPSDFEFLIAVVGICHLSLEDFSESFASGVAIFMRRDVCRRNGIDFGDNSSPAAEAKNSQEKQISAHRTPHFEL